MLLLFLYLILEVIVIFLLSFFGCFYYFAFYYSLFLLLFLFLYIFSTALPFPLIDHLFHFSSQSIFFFYFLNGWAVRDDVVMWASFKSNFDNNDLAFVCVCHMWLICVSGICVYMCIFHMCIFLFGSLFVFVFMRVFCYGLCVFLDFCFTLSLFLRSVFLFMCFYVWVFTFRFNPISQHSVFPQSLSLVF